MSKENIYIIKEQGNQEYMQFPKDSDSINL